jgi:predicted AlkP superfamily pyrophosphatase or phosphodiesterase
MAPLVIVSTHGHFPDDPRLHAAFIAAGPGVSVGRIGVLDQLDVAPTAAALLDMAMPTAERRASALVLRDS